MKIYLKTEQRKAYTIQYKLYLNLIIIISKKLMVSKIMHVGTKKKKNIYNNHNVLHIKKNNFKT